MITCKTPGSIGDRLFIPSDWRERTFYEVVSAPASGYRPGACFSSLDMHYMLIECTIEVGTVLRRGNKLYRVELKRQHRNGIMLRRWQE